MKHLFLASAIALTTAISCVWAQPEILWSNTYQTTAEAEVCNDIVALDDSLFIISGNARLTAYHTCMLTMHVDNEGSINGRYLHGSDDHLLCNAMSVRPDGSLILVGSLTISQPNPHRDGYVTVVCGHDSIAALSYGSLGVDQFNAVTQDTGGTVIMAGSTTSSGAGESDFWLVSAAPPAPGPIYRTYGGHEADECNDIILTDDMGYLLAGMTKSFGPGTRCMYIIKTNAFGDSLWSRVIGSSGSQECNAVIQTFDGGFALAGHDNFEFWLVRTDQNGNVLWSQVYEGFECCDLVYTRDGGFLLVGDIWTGGDAEWDGRVVRTDSEGNELWSLTIDKDIDDHFYAADLSPDGSFILGGYTNATNGPDRLWLVKLGVESPIITVDRSQSETPVVRWISPLSGDYTIYSTTNPNHRTSTLPGPGWTWETTLPNLPPGAASWTDPGLLQEHKYYIVTHSTL